MMTLAISVIPVSSVGILLVNGQRSWHRSYQSANRPTVVDSQYALSLFERTGRKSDGQRSVILPSGSSIAEPQMNMAQTGKAVEFRYWSQERPDGLEPTEYLRIFFFLDNSFDEPQGQLRMERGRYPYEINHRTVYENGQMIIARNVTSVSFRRTVINKAAQNCIHMALTLTDPADDKVSNLTAVTLMHN